MSDPIPPDLPKPGVRETSPNEAYIRALKSFESFIDGQVLGSVKSNAFCDFVDFQRADIIAERKPDDIGVQMQRELIRETVRQRSNEVPNYKASWRTLVEYYETLKSAGIKIEYRPDSISSTLNGIRNEHIVNATSPSEPGTPQAPLAPLAPPPQPAPFA